MPSKKTFFLFSSSFSILHTPLTVIFIFQKPFWLKNKFTQISHFFSFSFKNFFFIFRVLVCPQFFSFPLLFKPPNERMGQN
ncbi:unnamed protein product [Meloidogyne enterolobii]|uniref:Uncharacterized protein n=1 Tax=Meloidogyne enterolobii TaxID=390850 RepID=A0ACB0YQ29_MELEN